MDSPFRTKMSVISAGKTSAKLALKLAPNSLCELAALADRLIDALNSTEPDCDFEVSHDQEAIDEREPDSEGGAGFWDTDQRYCVMNAAFMDNRVKVDDFPMR